MLIVILFKDYLYGYEFYGYAWGDIEYISLDNVDNSKENLNIPVPITKYDKWYEDFKIINKRLLII